ncbi:MAG TPA: hypothetical protein VLV15_01975, partial [Dongiaceae bacterium]|nr:hypothetical protein [Dongiaceae bacterium]
MPRVSAAPRAPAAPVHSRVSRDTTPPRTTARGQLPCISRLALEHPDTAAHPHRCGRHPSLNVKHLR